MENIEEPTYEFVSPNDRICHVVYKVDKAVVATFYWEEYDQCWRWPNPAFNSPYGEYPRKYLTLDACKAAYAEYAKPRMSYVTMEQLSTKKKSWWPF